MWDYITQTSWFANDRIMNVGVEVQEFLSPVKSIGLCDPHERVTSTNTHKTYLYWYYYKYEPVSFVSVLTYWCSSFLEARDVLDKLGCKEGLIVLMI